MRTHPGSSLALVALASIVAGCGEGARTSVTATTGEDIINEFWCDYPTPRGDDPFSAVAEFGLLLRDSPNKGSATWDEALALAESSQGPDRAGYRREFLELVRKARSLAAR